MKNLKMMLNKKIEKKHINSLWIVEQPGMKIFPKDVCQLNKSGFKIFKVVTIPKRTVY